MENSRLRITKKLLAILMLITVLFTFLPMNAFVVYADNTPAQCNHQWSTTWTQKTSATCTDAEVLERECLVDGCNEKEEKAGAPALGHKYELVPAKSGGPTCTKAGVGEYRCTRVKANGDVCDVVNSEMGTRTMGALGHRFDKSEKTGICENCETYTCPHTSKTVTNETAQLPTCTVAGHKLATCDTCGKDDLQIAVEALGHDMEVTITKEATCTQTGTKVLKCKREGCNQSSQTNYTVPHQYDSNGKCTVCKAACTHRYDTTVSESGDGYVSNNDATCKTDGTKTRVCLDCKAVDTKTDTGSKNKVKHTYVTKDNKVVCSVCDYQCPHTNKTFDATKAVAATCKTTGREGVYVCDECKTEVAEGKTIPVLPHEFDKNQANGICTLCLEKVCDHKKDGSFDTTSKLTLPTCTEAGVQEEVCNTCGYVVESTTIKALGHDFKTYEDDSKATCTEPAKEKAKCERCDATDIRDKAGSVALGHNPKATEETITEATCEKNEVKGIKCTDCGEVIEGSKYEVENTAKEHDWKVSRTVKPTCEEEGFTVSKCTLCEKEKTGDIVKATGHDYKTKTTKATLSKDGSIVNVCANCGKSKGATTKIAKISTVKLAKTSLVYNGKAQKPSVTVKDANGKTIAAKNYTVTYASGCKNVGTYTVKVAFKGNYSGTKTLTFTIAPTATTVSKVTAGSKKFTVKYAKKTAQVTGYEVQYSTSKTFAKGNKTVKVSKNSTTSKTVSSLKAKTKYFVRVRTYKTVNGKAVYSAWSSAKTVTTKK